MLHRSGAVAWVSAALAVIVIVGAVWITHHRSNSLTYSPYVTPLTPQQQSFEQDATVRETLFESEGALETLHDDQPGGLGSSSTALVNNLTTDAPGESYTTGAVSAPNEISVSLGPDGQVVVLAAYSETGDCLFLELNFETKGGTGGMTGVSPAQGTSVGQNSGGVCAAGTPPGEGPSSVQWQMP